MGHSQRGGGPTAGDAGPDLNARPQSGALLGVRAWQSSEENPRSRYKRSG